MPPKKKKMKNEKIENLEVSEKQTTLNESNGEILEEKQPQSNTAEQPNGDNKIIDKKWIILFFILVGVISFVSYEVLKSGDNFDHKGLKFNIEKSGDIKFYHYYYFFTDELSQQYKYNLYLQNDPRKNNVPIDGGIEFPKGYTVFISINESGLRECDKTNLAIHMLSTFLRDNMIKVAPASPDEEIAKERNITFANCSSFMDNTVILLQKGEETSVRKQGNCHIITDSGCDILLAVEKFMVEAIVEAKNRTASM